MRDKKIPKTRAEIGEQRRFKMRARLISSAARVIARGGQQKATIDDFVREANVARGTFYNYFTTREELLEALWATYGHDPYFEIQRICQPIQDPVERLAAFTRHVLHTAKREPTWGWLIVALSADRATVNDDLISYPIPDLKAGEATGAIHFDDLACARDLVVGSVRSGLRALLEEAREEHYPESLCKMILCALGMRRSDAHRISHAPLPPLILQASA